MQPIDFLESEALELQACNFPKNVSYWNCYYDNPSEYWDNCKKISMTDDDEYYQFCLDTHNNCIIWVELNYNKKIVKVNLDDVNYYLWRNEPYLKGTISEEEFIQILNEAEIVDVIE